MFGNKKLGKDLQSKGFVKFLTRLFRFVFFPFIHPLVFVLLLVIIIGLLFAWPLYNGVKLADMSDWYYSKVGYYYELVKTNLFDKEDITNKVGFGKISGGIEENAINVKTIEKKPGKDEIIVYETPQMLNRKAFEAAQEVPVDVKKTFEHAKKVAEPENSLFKFKRNDSLGLTYLENPIKVDGEAKVVNANEIKVGDRVLFLYGIYTHPASEGGKAAVEYMKQNVEGKIISCMIVAYTNAAVPTGLCVLDEVSLNQKLVELGYSNDVTLN